MKFIIWTGANARTNAFGCFEPNKAVEVPDHIGAELLQNPRFKEAPKSLVSEMQETTDIAGLQGRIVQLAELNDQLTEENETLSVENTRLLKENGLLRESLGEGELQAEEGDSAEDDAGNDSDEE